MRLVFIHIPVLTIALFSQTLFAAETTQQQLPIEVTADQLIAQDKKGQSVYSGRVEIVQGTTTIKGDKVTLQHPERQFTEAVILGQPATFKRFVEEDQQWINGHADKITYQADKKTVLLEGNAYVNQEGQNSISGPKIFYDMAEKTLRATGNKQQKKRIKVIFTPEDEQTNQKETP